ncbi:CACTA en-spm transposon protein [Cucumis melo var. makuwa]|uniref:CACTA en-spm transposon protein n=1 Tax=Cucumis melo var. makuwa TaxID=1194695 RepID=A0A5D3D841_CUCMM|nr:CACTA en-spm transposon protein [Cucumis melo var. makuwa]TYK19735.1 CACTA en-spm transposon protein [Cucumis melo var. makuwa]
MSSTISLYTSKDYCDHANHTTKKWIIPNAENNVGIRNVGNKGFSDAVNTASGKASGKHYFPTHPESVGKNSSGEGGIARRRGTASGEAERGEERIVVAVPCYAAVLAAVQPPSATLESSSQQATPTPRRRAQSRLLELERHVAINGRIPMMITPGAEKPISLHAVRFSQAIGVYVRKTFPVRCLKWADVGREYIEVVKGDLHRLFVLDFNDQAMNGFVEHQMLTTFKEFRADFHRHFKKYSDPEEARANPPNALVERDEDWHFLCDH